MLTVQKVESVRMLFHPTRQRRYVFVRVGDMVRVTSYNEHGRHQCELPLEAGRSRWWFLRRLGYLTWEEMPHAITDTVVN